MLYLQKEPLDRVFFRIFGLEIYWYAVLIISGAMLAYFLALREGKRIGVDSDFIDTLVIFGLPIAIIGARIYYVIFEWSSFSGDLLSILDLRSGGLAIYGGVIAALIWGFWLCRYRDVDFLESSI